MDHNYTNHDYMGLNYIGHNYRGTHVYPDAYTHQVMLGQCYRMAEGVERDADLVITRAH